MAAVSGSRNIERLASALANLIYEGKPTEVAQHRLFQAEFNVLLNGIKKAFNYKITDAAWNTPDRELLSNIYNNIYQFAGAKNYHELRDLTSALADGDRIRSFSEFTTEAKGIIGKYNRTWLHAEYNQAIAAGQAAARWRDFQKNAKDMPYLQYQAVMDANTRDEHAALHGIIKKISDPFWSRFYPPNGWGCRCEAIQMPNSNLKETPDSKIQLPRVPIMFQINFGEQGIIFPQGHAYYKRVPEQYQKEVLARGRAEVRRIIANAEAYEKYKRNPDYKDCKFNWINGGLKATHIGHNFDPKTGHYEKEVQNIGFKNGHSVVLENERNGENNQKFTEGLWDGKTFEIGTSLGAGKNNIKHILNHCREKGAKIAVIHFPSKELFTRERLFDGIFKYQGQSEYRFDQIIYIVDENINYINKKATL